MSDDPLGIELSLGPLHVNVKGLWGLLTRRSKKDPAALAAQRFLQLFEDHGVAPTQIQQFLPSVTLYTLQSPCALLNALTSDVLDQTAKLFGVRRQWLEGVGDQIYECRTCYKNPAGFFEDLAGILRNAHSFPLRAFYSTKTLDAHDGRHQPLALFLVSKLKDMGDEEVFRYLVYHDGWDWAELACRIQLKAMARLMFQVFHEPVPLYRVRPRVLEDIRLGRRVPRQYMQGSPLTEPSLEDFALSHKESAKAAECEELSEVLHYIRHHHLQAIDLKPFTA
jgi:hypothetical protein